MEGHGHGLLDLHVPTKAFLTYKNRSSKISFKRSKKCRGLVGGPGFEKIRVADWHIRSLLHQTLYTSGHVCAYFPLEFGERAAYMETHPKPILMSKYVRS